MPNLCCQLTFYFSSPNFSSKLQIHKSTCLLSLRLMSITSNFLQSSHVNFILPVVQDQNLEVVLNFCISLKIHIKLPKILMHLSSKCTLNLTTSHYLHYYHPGPSSPPGPPYYPLTPLPASDCGAPPQ